MTSYELRPAAQRSPVDSPAAWKGAELLDSNEWIHQFSQEELSELDQALQYAKAKKLATTQISAVDFPLSKLRDVIEELVDVLVDGRGFKLLRGFPALEYSKEDASKVFWGIGAHIGKAWPQNKAGDLLGDIRDEGIEITPTNNIRGYQTRITLPFHTDRGDFVCLLCLRVAKSGGSSSLVSSVACHNEIARRRPDLLERLYNPFYYDMRGEHREGGKPFYPAPVFTEHKGRLFNRYVRGYISSAQRFDDAPKLSDSDVEALDYLDHLMKKPSMHLNMDLQPGDMQFVNNYTVFHARTEFSDYEEPDHKRHLRRLWLTTDRMPDRPAAFVLSSKNRGLL